MYHGWKQHISTVSCWRSLSIHKTMIILWVSLWVYVPGFLVNDSTSLFGTLKRPSALEGDLSSKFGPVWRGPSIHASDSIDWNSLLASLIASCNLVFKLSSSVFPAFGLKPGCPTDSKRLSRFESSLSLHTSMPWVNAGVCLDRILFSMILAHLNIVHTVSSCQMMWSPSYNVECPVCII